MVDGVHEVYLDALQAWARLEPAELGAIMKGLLQRGWNVAAQGPAVTARPSLLLSHRRYGGQRFLLYLNRLDVLSGLLELLPDCDSEELSHWVHTNLDRP